MCGIFAAYNCRKAAEFTYAGLHAIQHRAQDYAGIVTSDGVNLYRHAGPGIVQEVFDNKALSRLHGLHAVGHIRYPTVGDEIEQQSEREKTQPIVSAFNNREVAIAHNGNIMNYEQLLSLLRRHQLKTSIDTEVMMRLFCESDASDDIHRVFDAVCQARGTYSLVFLYEDVMIAVRDPFGNRPLALGRKDDAWFVSSETVAFDNLGIKYVRDIAPGEILVITKYGQRSAYFNEQGVSLKPLDHDRSGCCFESIYYSHPGSCINDCGVANFQKEAGRLLYRECPTDGDIVIGVPDSAMFHALGYANESGIPFELGITRSHYIGRTFIEPFQWLRDLKVRRKFTVIRELVKGKRIILVDDSIFRLTTMMGLVDLLWAAEVAEIHARIASAPIVYPCFYGIDVPSQKELAAANWTLEEIRQRTKLTSLYYLSMPGLKSLFKNPDNHCFACMDGQYKIAPELCQK